MIVVDSNVLVYLYLPGDRTSAAESLLQSDPNWSAPILWRSEFRNILVGYAKQSRVTLDQAWRMQHEAEDLMNGAEYEVDSTSVLQLAYESGCSAYDCEYVALAMKLGVPLVTWWIDPAKEKALAEKRGK